MRFTGLAPTCQLFERLLWRSKQWKRWNLKPNFHCAKGCRAKAAENSPDAFHNNRNLSRDNHSHQTLTDLKWLLSIEDLFLNGFFHEAKQAWECRSWFSNRQICTVAGILLVFCTRDEQPSLGKDFFDQSCKGKKHWGLEKPPSEIQRLVKSLLALMLWIDALKCVERKLQTESTAEEEITRACLAGKAIWIRNKDIGWTVA